MGKRNHSRNLRNQCTIATGIIAVREIIIKGEFTMEEALFAQKSWNGSLQKWINELQ